MAWLTTFKDIVFDFLVFFNGRPTLHKAVFRAGEGLVKHGKRAFGLQAATLAGVAGGRAVFLRFNLFVIDHVMGREVLRGDIYQVDIAIGPGFARVLAL